ncbi:MAG TPA: DNA-processing protein DprA [Candidatus Omnitrophota bacterium]|nr:DNA-processing protein DprA [Candidatus Omnitrophota bacterium]HPN56356.1 DNA-processing protein DprA [Candidatus Omnitrophota bacterium]
MTEKEAAVVLNAVPGLSNRMVLRLIGHFGTAVAVLRAKSRVFAGIEGVSAAAVKNIRCFEQDEFLKKEYSLCSSLKIQVTTLWEDGFPRILKQIPDCPVVLYHKGDIRHEDDTSVAVIGSRRATVYGRLVAEQLASRLADFGITVVSGMARGIDSAAHTGSLKARGRTLAVLGCGLTHIYPPENEGLMETIARHGAVLSEFPLETAPLRYNFPRRNRIISGLSLGVIVVEAHRRSGALITSRFALEQGREVFSVPGRVDQPASWGTNQLIKDGARVVLGVEDILEELRIPLRNCPSQRVFQERASGRGGLKPAAGMNLTAGQQLIYDNLDGKPVHIDGLAAQCQKAGTEITEALLQMELRGFVKRWPGQYYSKIEHL